MQVGAFIKGVAGAVVLPGALTSGRLSDTVGNGGVCAYNSGHTAFSSVNEIKLLLSS